MHKYAQNNYQNDTVQIYVKNYISLFLQNNSILNTTSQVKGWQVQQNLFYAFLILNYGKNTMPDNFSNP